MQVASLHSKLLYHDRLLGAVGNGSAVVDVVGDDPLVVRCRDLPVVWIDVHGRKGDIVKVYVSDKVYALRSAISRLQISQTAPLQATHMIRSLMTNMAQPF